MLTANDLDLICTMWSILVRRGSAIDPMVYVAIRILELVLNYTWEAYRYAYVRDTGSSHLILD